ncbi:sn-glycerol-1-phosphate dehydrogenase [Paenibacillus sp. Y412MC10]|uniref:sn-glycerol-1-phosphate dehydrogenase n=1 Tax=Geobacillus sp. (strain Y412MC10) TaxID=481743 RepID=UPI00119FB9F1|nr:sn-glycerol-1-phosphate dehydrogenase [Paenibacillus sp. Y412MC10]
MTDWLKDIREAAGRMDDADERLADICPVVLESGAIRKAGAFLQDQDYRRVIVTADKNTFAAAGEQLMESVTEAGVNASVTFISPDEQGDVIADERSIVQLLLDVKSSKADAVVALGSGTLHDVSRFAAYSAGIPFVSVPTAPSVDGFNSKGAPLIIRGEKITIQSIGPAAIFADLDILTAAPRTMVAAGFGDMLGKCTSLFDWTFGSLTADEPYSEIVAEITTKALQQCVDHIDAIADRTPEGIRVLTQALIESGFAMLLFGQSHPASGAEHHLSHYWEMAFLREGRRAVLHGAKVGVACAEISQLYHRLDAENSLPVAEEQLERVRAELAKVPSPDTLRAWLRKVGGPASIQELDIDPELLKRSLAEADQIRPNRHTLLRAVNDQRRT